jgi:exopolyphosphatase/guanosine-5'-triphosphate,3'-diphosphate pyrophosphatase
MSPSPAFSATILAAVDIGTLTCRLIIGQILPGGRLKTLQSERRIVRLGQGVDQARRLRVDAMDRVIAVLKEWRHVIDGYHVEAMILVATSAVRDAANRDEFLDRVKSATGFAVEVITGEEEARCTLLGIRSGLPVGITDMLALDIGGGSTEFILDKPPQPLTIRSIDIGVVRVSERMLHGDPPTTGQVQQAREWIRKEISTAVTGMDRPAGLAYVGTAGTITSLAAMAQKLAAYEPAQIHNYTLAIQTVQELEQRLLSRSKAQRVGMPGLEPGREEVIAAGAIILRTVMDTLDVKIILVSDLGLREGVLIDLANKMRQQRGESV